MIKRKLKNIFQRKTYHPAPVPKIKQYSFWIFFAMVGVLFLVQSAFGYDPNLDVSFFKKKVNYKDTLFFIGSGVAIGVLILFIIFYKIKTSLEFKSTKKQIRQMQQEMVLQTQHLTSETESDISQLAKATQTPVELISADNQTFEETVDKFILNNPDDPFIGKIESLRDDLGFVFANRKTLFYSSKMLQTGQKVRVGVKFKGKAHSYVGTILNKNEFEFWVKPPTVKGKVIDLLKFKKLQFRVFRQHDGDYSFTASIKSQIKTPMVAVVCVHSNNIKKLKMRSQDRFELKLNLKIYFLLATKTSTGEESTGFERNGVVEDISVGGMKLAIKQIPKNCIVGTNVVFSIQEANIKHEIQSSIVRINPGKEMSYLHFQFNNLTELDRLNLQKFFTAKNSKKIIEK